MRLPSADCELQHSSISYCRYKQGKLGATDVSDPSKRTFFTVNDLPMSQRYDVWQNSIDCIFDVETTPEIRKNKFFATLEADLVGSMMLARTKSTHQFWSRTPSAIAADGMDHYMLQFYYSGGASSDQGKDGSEIAPGGLMFQDLSQTARATTSDFDNLVIIVPRDLLEGRLVLPEDHNMRFLGNSDPMVRILADQIVSLKKNAPYLLPEHASTLEHTFAETLASCLNSAHGQTSSSSHRRQNLETMISIRRYFRQNFASPDLTPDIAARDLGLSRSKLYQLCEDQGGVYQYIRDLRLRHAMSILCDQQNRDRPLYDIALECGFSSDASFIRAFRGKFDITPGDIRRGHSPKREDGAPIADHIDTRYEKWLHTL